MTPAITPRKLPAHTRPGTLTTKECARIKELWEQGLNKVQIATRMQVSETTVRRVLKGNYTPQDYLTANAR